jgi:hypothetical protein
MIQAQLSETYFSLSLDSECFCKLDDLSVDFSMFALGFARGLPVNGDDGPLLISEETSEVG